MTYTDDRVTLPYQSPDAIRNESFQRRLRGLDAQEVYEYLDQLADQVDGCESRLNVARANNDRLVAEGQRLRAEVDEYERTSERVNEQMVQLFSQAQLIAEEMVQDVSRDAQERIGQARAHERDIVEQAVNAAGEQVRSYARSAQAQMQSIMDSFASDVDRLGVPGLAGNATSVRRPDPLLDDLDAWETQVRNGSGPAYPS